MKLTTWLFKNDKPIIHVVHGKYFDPGGAELKINIRQYSPYGLPKLSGRNIFLIHVLSK